MEKIKKWINKNKGLSIIILLALVLFIIMIIIFAQLLIGGSSNKYGNRLDGIENVKISSDTYENVKLELQDSQVVESSEVRLQGRIVYTAIVLKDDTGIDKAKELASATLRNYSEDELDFYDFSFFLKWENEDGDKVITGNKHHNLETITWTKS